MPDQQLNQPASVEEVIQPDKDIADSSEPDLGEEKWKAI